MNTLCLENYGVSKMETREMETTDGGFFPIVASLVCGALIVAYIGASFEAGRKAACDC